MFPPRLLTAVALQCNHTLLPSARSASSPKWLERAHDPLHLLRWHEMGDRAADHVNRFGMQQRPEPRIRVEDAHVGADAGYPQRRLDDHLVEQRGSSLNLRLGATAFDEQVQGVAVGEDLVEHEQHADAAGEDRQELVHGLVDEGDAYRHQSRRQRGDPGQGHLPELDRSLFGLAFHTRHRPQRRERDQEIADDPADVEDAADRAVRAVGGEVGERAV